MKTKVVVIGAGWNGLYVAKQLLEHGIEGCGIVILERREDLGGVWLLDPTRKHPSVFQGTYTTSSRVFTQAGDFPMPRGVEFPRHTEVLEYLREYAQHFAIRPLIRFEHEVRSVVKATGTWVVHALDHGGKGKRGHPHGGDGRVQAVSFECDYVVVCSGNNAIPYDAVGLQKSLVGFTGEIVHSQDYLSPVPFEGKRVVLVGAGETAADVALEISTVARLTALSAPSGLMLIPKAGYFLPLKESMLPLDSISSWLRLVVVPTTMNTWLSPMGIFQALFGTYGHGIKQWLGPPPYQDPPPCHVSEWPRDMMDRKPELTRCSSGVVPVWRRFFTKNTELAARVHSGRITPVSGLVVAHGRSLHFECGAIIPDVDVVLKCTGFRPDHSFLESRFHCPACHCVACNASQQPTSASEKNGQGAVRRRSMRVRASSTASASAMHSQGWGDVEPPPDLGGEKDPPYPRNLYKMVFHTDDPTLCFVGTTRPVVGSIPIIGEWHALMVARSITGKLQLPPRRVMREVMRREAGYWRQYFRFDGGDKRPPLVDLSVHLRSLVADGLIPSYSPLRAWRLRGFRFALMHTIVPLNNGFLYLDDPAKAARVEAEYRHMQELQSLYSILYTLFLHALLFIFSVPTSLVYFSIVEPRYVWEWWCGGITGRLRPTPRWFCPCLKIITVAIQGCIISSILLWLVRTIGTGIHEEK